MYEWHIGDKYPGTSLTLVRFILPRRGEFLCDCGRYVPINFSAIEQSYHPRKSCGCGSHKKEGT